MPRTGLEPARPCGHQALNLARLPIPPPRRTANRIIGWRRGTSSPPSGNLHAPADPVVGEPVPFHRLRFVQVPPVENDRLVEQSPHHLEVRVAELLPLGDDRESVGPFHHPVWP